MKSLRHIAISLLTVMAATLAARAEEPDERPLRPVFAAYTLEAGSSHLADTYLTPLKYAGWHAALDYSRYQAMRFAPDEWVMRLHGNLSVDRADNPARNASMWNATLTLGWGMMRRFRPLPSLTLAAGGMTELRAGCLYNARNGNNPASAKGEWTLGLTGYAAWSMRVGRLPVTFMYQPVLPVTGIFFAPDYGELYYEIYLGNHNGLVHGAWWGNHFRLDNLVTADLHLGSTSLRIGYRGDIFSSKVNHTVTHIFTHALVIGVSGEWLSYDPRRHRAASRARIISPIP